MSCSGNLRLPVSRLDISLCRSISVQRNGIQFLCQVTDGLIDAVRCRYGWVSEGKIIDIFRSPQLLRAACHTQIIHGLPNAGFLIDTYLLLRTFYFPPHIIRCFLLKFKAFSTFLYLLFFKLSLLTCQIIFILQPAQPLDLLPEIVRRHAKRPRLMTVSCSSPSFVATVTRYLCPISCTVRSINASAVSSVFV